MDKLGPISFNIDARAYFKRLKKNYLSALMARGQTIQICDDDSMLDITCI